jgi:superfamily II DNA helicase RecQ
MVRQKLRKYKAGKIVAYGHSMVNVKALAEKIGCQAYYLAAVGKAGMLEAFMAGRQRIIVATSALGIGVDVPDIWCIIHINRPFSVLYYTQEGDRDGSQARRSWWCRTAISEHPRTSRRRQSRR